LSSKKDSFFNLLQMTKVENKNELDSGKDE
jgi:hypothetical protein